MRPELAIYEDNHVLQYEVDLPGYNVQDLEITLEDSALTLKGKREVFENGYKNIFHYTRKFYAPFKPNPGSVSSNYDYGLLCLNIKKDLNSDQDGPGFPSQRKEYYQDKIRIILDAKHFRPEEIEVKNQGDDVIVVITQTVKEGHTTRTSVFEKTFAMPTSILGYAVTSKLTGAGMLEITVPKKM